jgi:thiamine pyrophosphate-dependent acetolactate synthase large subunit-like protein
MGDAYTCMTPALLPTRNILATAFMAEAMGAEGIRVEQLSDLKGAIERAFAARRPCVVEVLSDPDAVATLAWVEKEV